MALDSATPRPIRIVDVFSGAGGLSLGWMAAVGNGFRLVAAIDDDAALADVYRWNYPGTRFVRHTFGDALVEDETETVCAKAELEPATIDVLLAGPPCQTMSAAGKRRPHAHNHLAIHVCRLAGFLRPKVVVIENVPEFGWIQDGRLLGRVRVALDQAGYFTDTVNLNAATFGLPQTRTRCFVLALEKALTVEKDWSTPRSLRPSPTHEYQPSQNAGARQPRLPVSGSQLLPPTTVAEAIDDLPPLAAGEGQEIACLQSRPTSTYQVALRDGQAKLYNHLAVRHSADIVARLALLQPGETPQRTVGHPLRRKDYFRAAYARLHPGSVAPTMTTQTHNPGSGRFTHYRDHRVLTVREVARLQGFSDSFRFFGNQETQRRHVGNAVPPLLARAIAGALLRIVVD